VKYEMSWPAGSSKASIAAFLILAANAAAQLSPEQRRANMQSFEQVWSTVKDKHWDATLGGLDWGAARDEFRPRMDRARTMDEARSVLRDMLNRLGQSHFVLHPAGEPEELDTEASEAGRDGTCGMDVRVLGGRATVTRVTGGSAAEAAGVRPGWLVLRIEGEELTIALREIEQRYRSSTLLDSKLAWAVQRHLSGKLDQRASIDFLDGDGRITPLAIAFTQRPGIKVRLSNMPPRYVYFHSRLIRPDVGYITFNTWFDPPFLLSKMEGATHVLKNPRGIIVDLRGARGGQVGLAPLIAGYFVQQHGQKLGTLIHREGQDQLAISPQPGAYGCPLAILVDGLTRSTSEVFASGLKQIGRARIFGSRTAGAVQGSLVDKLPNGDGFQYVISKFVTTVGEPLEGVGVTPDVAILPTREVLLSGRDPALEAAVEWICTRIDPRR
jgi:carboxyl-terminal processing protease